MVVAAAVTAMLFAQALPSLATFRPTTAASNTVSTATLQPPTGLGGTTSCSGPGTAQASLTWTATASAFADGYDVYRGTSNGGPYSNIAHVSGGATASYADPGPLADGNKHYYYVLKSTFGTSWTSLNSSQANLQTPNKC